MIIKSIHALLCAAAIFSVAIMHGQTSSPAASNGEAIGTIKEYTPGSAIILDGLTPNPPASFKLARTVIYNDADGKTIEAAGLTTGQRVRVHYVKAGGENVADKISLVAN